MDNPKQIRLLPHNTGDLLSETVRAYLHSANPSALIGRILEGVRARQNAMNLHSTKEDDDLMVRLRDQLTFMHEEWRKLEDETYR